MSTVPLPLPTGELDRFVIADALAAGRRLDDDSILAALRGWRDGLREHEDHAAADFVARLITPREVAALAALAHQRRRAPSGLRVELADLAEDELTPTLLPREDGVHLFYPGQIHSLYGPKSSAKSLILLAEAVRLLQLGERVLYLNYEGQPAQVKARLRRLGATREDLARFVYVRGFGASLTPAQRREWELLLEETFALAIVDTVNAGMAAWELDPLKTAEVRRFYGEIAEPLAASSGQPAVVLSDHCAKQAPQRGNGVATVYGSEAKTSALDAAYLVKVIEKPGVGRIGVVDLVCTKDRHDYVFAHTPDAKAAEDGSFTAARVTVDGTGESTVLSIAVPEPEAAASGATATVREMSQLRDTVLRMHRQEPGITSASLVDRVRAYDRHYSPTQIRAARDELVSLGALVMAPGVKGNEKRYVLADGVEVPPGPVTDTEHVGRPLDRRLPNAFAAGPDGQVPLETKLDIHDGGRS